MTGVSKGDTISVTREGLEVIDVRDGRVWAKDSEGSVRSYYTSKVGLVVTKKAGPKNWPPKNGDVWKSEANSRTFHAIGTRLYRNSFGDVSSAYSADSVLRDYPDIRLVFRNF